MQHFYTLNLKNSEIIKASKLKIWNEYFEGFQQLEELGILKRPIIPKSCTHNGHLFFLILENHQIRNKLILHLKKQNIHSVFHYVPLHSSPAGKRYTKTQGDLRITEDLSGRLLRLPSWIGFSQTKQVIESVTKFYK